MKPPRPVRVQVVSPAEAERCDFVVCMPAGSWTPFLDNRATWCAVCKQAIIHRPDAPRTPPKICLSCALVLGTTHGQAKN